MARGTAAAAPVVAKRKMLWGKAPSQSKQWDSVALLNDETGERKSKFLKLMGGRKKGTTADSPPPSAEPVTPPTRTVIDGQEFVTALPLWRKFNSILPGKRS